MQKAIIGAFCGDIEGVVTTNFPGGVPLDPLECITHYAVETALRLGGSHNKITPGWAGWVAKIDIKRWLLNMIWFNKIGSALNLNFGWFKFKLNNETHNLLWITWVLNCTISVFSYLDIARKDTVKIAIQIWFNKREGYNKKLLWIRRVQYDLGWSG